jgi:hypothetical protein
LEFVELLPEVARLYHEDSAPAGGYPLILETPKFAIVHDWCDVWLRAPDRDPVSIGTHYEEPRAFVLSADGRWCASAGCGVVIYHLRDPFRPFQGGVEADQWWEIGRDEDDPWLVDHLALLGDDRLRIVVDPDSPHGGSYDVDVTQRAIRSR